METGGNLFLTRVFDHDNYDQGDCLMLTELSLNCFLSVAVFLPLSFWTVFPSTVDRSFYRFNSGLNCFILSLGIFALIFSFFLSNHQISDTKIYNAKLIGALVSVLWLVILLVCVWSQWKKERPNVVILSIPSVIGILANLIILPHFISEVNLIKALGSTLIGGMALSLSLYAMILGHWYLNVEKMPIALLDKTVLVYMAVLSVRLLWNIFAVLTEQIEYEGYLFALPAFITSLEGFLIGVAIFFGVVFPFVSLILVRRTLHHKSTQAATGILYVIVVSAIIGDFSYRYYLLNYNVIL